MAERTACLPRQKSEDITSLVIPVWFELPRRFYECLAAAEREFGVPRAKILMRGLKLAVQEQQAKRLLAERSKSTDVDLSGALRRVAKMRWQVTSAEERKEVGRNLAAARWRKKEEKKSSKSDY